MQLQLSGSFRENCWILTFESHLFHLTHHMSDQSDCFHQTLTAFFPLTHQKTRISWRRQSFLYRRREVDMASSVEKETMEAPITRRARSTSSLSSCSGSSSRMKGQRGQKKTSSLPADTVEYLKAWMMSPEHIAHPYPTEQEKAQIMADTGIELKQLTNWFVNNRKRFWKPRVEARLQQHAHVQAAVRQCRVLPRLSWPPRRSSKRRRPSCGFGFPWLL